MVMTFYKTLWAKELRRNAIISISMAVFFLSTLLYLIIFPLNYQKGAIGFGLLYIFEMEFEGGQYYPLLAIVYLLSLAAFYFFFIMTLAYIREIARLGAAGIIDFVIVLAILMLLVYLINGVWMALIATLLMGLIIAFLFFALTGKGVRETLEEVIRSTPKLIKIPLSWLRSKKNTNSS